MPKLGTGSDVNFNLKNSEKTEKSHFLLIKWIFSSLLIIKKLSKLETGTDVNISKNSQKIAKSYFH